MLFVMAIMTTGDVKADVHPVLRLEFHVQEKDLTEVMDILARYAKKEGFSVENLGPRMPAKRRPVFYVVLDRSDSEQVLVTNFLKRDQMLLAFYTPKRDAQSLQIIDPLISELREKWPDIHVYTGP